MGKKGKKGKKSGGGKSGKGGKSGAGPAGEGGGDGKPEEQETPKEVLLKNELDSLNLQLEKVKLEVQDLRQQNDFLQAEAAATRNETHEYMSYMSKRANKRQETIVSLNDWNQQQLKQLEQQKQALLDKYEAEKAQLRDVILQKEKKLASTKQDIEDLGEYKVLQEKQLAQIQELSREVMRMRGVHTEKIQQIRADFLREKQAFKTESEQRISQMKKEANAEALRSLQSHTTEVKRENQELRRELMDLIHKSQSLQAHKKDLLQQRSVLQQEELYNQDILKIKQRRNQDVAI